MRRLIQWIVVVALAGTVVVGCACVILVSHIFFPSDFDANKVVYAADCKIDGFDFDVTLFRNHSALAEYRKVVKVKQGGKLITEKEFIDTGGFASFYLLRQGNRIIMLDGVRNGFVLDVQSAEVSKVEIDSLPENFPEHAFGRFMFVYGETRTYKWVAREDIPPEAK